MRDFIKLIYDEIDLPPMPKDEQGLILSLEKLQKAELDLLEHQEQFRQMSGRFEKYYGKKVMDSILEPSLERHSDWNEQEFCESLKKRWGPYWRFGKDKLKRPIIKALTNFILKHHPPKTFHKKHSKVVKRVEAGTILEVGCGCGHFMWMIRRLAGELIGLDSSTWMLDYTEQMFRATDKNPYKFRAKTKLMFGSCWQIPLPNESVDLAYQVDVCMHVGGSLRSIKEMLRVSRNAIFFTGPSFESDRRMDRRIGPMSWAVSAPLLEKKLMEYKKAGKIKNVYYMPRISTKTYNHKILVIEKGD